MSPQTCSGKEVKTALFIRDTYPVLTEDVARGSGEHLATALHLFECDMTRQDAAITQIRASMADAVSVEGYARQSHIEKSAKLYDVMNQAVETSCKV